MDIPVAVRVKVQEAALQRPPLTSHVVPSTRLISFCPDVAAERVYVGQAAVLRLDLSRVPKGEYRELARRGFRECVIERTRQACRANNVREAHQIVWALIQHIEAKEDD